MQSGRSFALGLQNTLEVGGGLLTETDSHATDAVLLIGDLNKTEAIATVNQAHGFGINSQR